MLKLLPDPFSSLRVCKDKNALITMSSCPELASNFPLSLLKVTDANSLNINSTFVLYPLPCKEL